MGDDRDTLTATDSPTRRDAIKTALKVGAYTVPVVLSASVPSRVAAQVTPPTGALTGTIRNASNGQPLPGATVAVGGVSATTNANGVYTIPNAPSGPQSVQTSAPGFSPRTDTVNIAPGSTTEFSTALVPVGASGNITIVLTWGAQPTDLDSHLTGPNTGGGRFHVWYSDQNPVPYASLDVDDTSSFGPETTTVSTVSGNFVPGEYRFYVHNYSNTPEFDVSQAVVSVFQGGVQVAQFNVGSAAGNPALDIWHVFNFTLQATPTGNGSIAPVMQFQASAPADPALVLDRRK